MTSERAVLGRGFLKSGKMSWRLKAALAAVLVVCVIRFGLVPLFDWHDSAMAKIKVLQGAVARKKALLANEGRLNELLEQARASFNETAQWLYLDVPDAQALQLRLQQELETLALAAGIRIGTTTWLSPSPGDIVQAPVKVRCEGAPDQLMRFIQRIETGERFLTIDRLVITAQGRTSTVTAELDVSAYGATPGQKGGQPAFPPAPASPGPTVPRQAPSAAAPPAPASPGPVAPRQGTPGAVAPGQFRPGPIAPRQGTPGQAGPVPRQGTPGAAPPGQFRPGPIAPRQGTPGQAAPAPTAPRPVPRRQHSPGPAAPRPAPSGAPS
jgi:Tfp pilus assembly protein PilO